MLKAGAVKYILEMIYPSRCPICDGVLPAGSGGGVCKKCAGKARHVEEPYCLRCGRPLRKEGGEKEFCADCGGRGEPFEYGRAVFVYDKYMQKSIAAFKYRGRAEYGKYYAEEAVRAYGGLIKKINPDALIPVPIHKNRRKKRGYNQAEIIADCMGEMVKVPVIKNLIARSRDTAPQKDLTKAERIKNLNSAFGVVEGSRELYRNVKCVIIIDDIYTTGSTIRACSSALKGAGVEKIYFICICTGKEI